MLSEMQHDLPRIVWKTDNKADFAIQGLLGLILVVMRINRLLPAEIREKASAPPPLHFTPGSGPRIKAAIPSLLKKISLLKARYTDDSNRPISKTKEHLLRHHHGGPDARL